MQNNEVKVDRRKYVKWEDHQGKTYEIVKYLRETNFKKVFKASDHHAGWIWSPVTGCLNGCLKCSQRTSPSIYSNSNPLGFIPLLKHDRLTAPSKTAFPITAQDPHDWRVLVDWQFTTDSARIKLRRLYPQFKS